MLLAYFDPAGLEYVWLRVLFTSLIFGGFEVWRVARERTPGSVAKCLLGVFIASLFVLCAAGEILAMEKNSRYEAAPQLKQSRFATIIAAPAA